MAVVLVSEGGNRFVGFWVVMVLDGLCSIGCFSSCFWWELIGEAL